MITYFGAMGFGDSRRTILTFVKDHADALNVSWVAGQRVVEGMDVRPPRYVISELFWWAHAVVLMVLLERHPQEQASSISSARFPNIFLHKREKSTAASLTRLDFEDEEADHLRRRERQGTSAWKTLCSIPMPARSAAAATSTVRRPVPVRRSTRSRSSTTSAGTSTSNGDELLAGRRAVRGRRHPRDDWEPSICL